MSTIARPYAVAAYEFASTANDLSAWENMLEVAAYIAEDSSVKQLLRNPSITVEKVKELFCGILKPLLNEERKNFIWLLSVNMRLGALPEIAKLFKDSLAAEQKTISAAVFSAVPLNEDYQQKLSKALAVRFKRQVELCYEVDPSLLGGVIIRAGDKVIDGSVRGRLSRLLDSF